MSYICRVKNVILILISVLMFTKPLWPVVDYIANYDYIVNVFCENIDKPELECDGKCYLSKELAKEAGADDKNPLNSKTSKTEIPQVIISEIVNEYEFVLQADHASIEEIGYLPNLNSLLLTSSIYHPPQLG